MLRTVLVIDDDEYERESIADVLEFYGYRVVTAPSAQSAPAVSPSLVVTAEAGNSATPVLRFAKPVELRWLTTQVRQLCPP